MEFRENRFNDIVFDECVDSLCMSTDAIILSAYIRQNAKAIGVELGAGSGIISLITASINKLKYIYAVEIQSKIHQKLCENVKNNGLEDKIQPILADIRDISSNDYPKTSVVFSNPPYLSKNSGKTSILDSKEIARREIFGEIFDFCQCAKKLLKTNGALYLIYRHNRLQSLLKALCDNDFAVKRMTFVHADVHHSPSAVVIEARLFGAYGLNVTRPLFLKNDSQDSDDMKYIYKNAFFPPDFY